MTRTLLRRALPAGALFLTLAVAACSGGDHSSGHSGSGVTTSASPGAVFNDADVAFAEHMSVHHQQAVVMSALAADRAADPRVKELAAEIEAAQSPEITAMAGWLTAWGRPPAPTGDGHNKGHESMPGMMSAADMTELAESTGKPFDTLFLTMMIAHHEGAVTMAEDQIANGTNPEAKALAAKIITGQQAEITTMKSLL